MEPCPRFKPRSIFEPDACHYWEDRNPREPAHCKHPAVMFCGTGGRKRAPRADSDDDGYPD